MSIISKETWDKFTQEEKLDLQELYEELAKTPKVERERIEVLDDIFPAGALHPQPLTYEDVAEELFDGENTFYISDIGSIVLAEGGRLIYDKHKLPNNCTSRKQAEKLLAINKLLNVAAYLNKNEDGTSWKPDWKNHQEKKWYLTLEDKVTIGYVMGDNSSIVYFRTEELTKQAIQILGEDVVRLALTTEY